MNYPGLVNVENAVGAAALAFLAGASADEIKSGIEKYQVWFAGSMCVTKLKIILYR